MLVNAYSEEGKIATSAIPGTRIIRSSLGILGATFSDVNNRERIWTVNALYSPLPGRAVGGVRAKLIDTKGFISFCNQRDLEVLLQLASPGKYCPWMDQTYEGPGDPNWLGLGVDNDDLLDDLFDKELEARAMSPHGRIDLGLCLERRVHDGHQNDYVETLMLINDTNPYTNETPDTYLETIERRWVSVERSAPRERANLWRKL